MWLLAAISINSMMAPYAAVIRVESKKHGLDPLLVAAVVYRESRFKNRCCHKGSHGLMQIQLKPRSCEKSMAKAEMMGLYDPARNIRRGVKLMAWWRSWWRKHHRNDGYHWLLHYNQGFGKCPNDKPRCSFKERIPIRTGKIGGYADRVLEIYHKLKKNEPRS